MTIDMRLSQVLGRMEADRLARVEASPAEGPARAARHA
jgi:hypothetical protein